MTSRRAGEGWKSFMAEHPLGEESGSEDFWCQYLDQNPDVLHRLLADVYQATYGAERPPSLDDLWDLMSAPRFSRAPFGEAVTDLLGSRSITWLAQQAGMAQPALSRLINGQRPIVIRNDPKGSMQRIEQVARALRVHPSYFEEWRRLWIMALLDSAFAGRPDLSIGVFRRYSGFEKSHMNGR